MKNVFELFLIFVGLVLACFIIFGCETLGNVEDIARVSREATPIIETGKEIADEIGQAEDVHDWAGIIEKIAYGVGAAAAVVGGEAYRRKRKAAKSNG